MAMEVMECTCSRDPHNHAHSVSGCMLHDPTRMQLISISVKDAEKAAKVETELLPRIRMCMHRWASRYAASEHAQKHVRETRLLIQEIDEVILQR